MARPESRFVYIGTSPGEKAAQDGYRVVAAQDGYRVVAAQEAS